MTQTEIPTTSELFQKHFGDTCAVGLKHPAITSFFDELVKVQEMEDRAAGRNLDYWNNLARPF